MQPVSIEGYFLLDRERESRVGGGKDWVQRREEDLIKRQDASRASPK